MITNNCSYAIKPKFPQLARAVEFTNSFFAEGQDSPNECPAMTLNTLMLRLQ